MSAQFLIAECAKAGIKLHLQDGSIRLRGEQVLVKTWSEKLRPFKSEILEILAATANSDDDIWGEYTPYCPPRPQSEWLAMIAELDALIGQFCNRFKLSNDAQLRLLDARLHQPLSTIPGSLGWFRKELGHESNGGSADQPANGSPAMAQGP